MTIISNTVAAFNSHIHKTTGAFPVSQEKTLEMGTLYVYLNESEDKRKEFDKFVGLDLNGKGGEKRRKTVIVPDDAPDEVPEQIPHDQN